MKPSGQFTSIGGQAVIEGVMMRSPHFISVAVRKANQKISIQNRPYQGLSGRYPILKKPILRGITTLLESMIQGIEALSYSANIASEGEAGEGETLSSWAIALSIGSAILLGIGLFVALPHLLTALFFSSSSDGVITAKSPLFHLMDGTIKMGILLAYIYIIALMDDINRVFQYHGAEHKSIYTFEAGEDLTVENARKHSTLHPRCGTSFLLFLVVISILAFSVIFPLFGLTQLSEIPFLNHVMMILVKVVLMLPVAGVAYEFIKVCAFRMDSPIFRALIWPGMVLQKATTREPSDDQLEVALASLRQVLRLEKGSPVLNESEIEVSQLSELAMVHAEVTEFPEK